MVLTCARARIETVHGGDGARKGAGRRQERAVHRRDWVCKGAEQVRSIPLVFVFNFRLFVVVGSGCFILYNLYLQHHI